jgi:hypothetical protein
MMEYFSAKKKKKKNEWTDLSNAMLSDRNQSQSGYYRVLFIQHSRIGKTARMEERAVVYQGQR